WGCGCRPPFVFGQALHGDLAENALACGDVGSIFHEDAWLYLYPRCRGIYTRYPRRERSVPTRADQGEFSAALTARSSGRIGKSIGPHIDDLDHVVSIV